MRSAFIAAILLTLSALVGCTTGINHPGGSPRNHVREIPITIDRAVALAVRELHRDLPKDYTNYWMKGKRSIAEDGWVFDFYIFPRGRPADENYYIPGSNVTIWVSDKGKVDRFDGH